MQGKIIKGIAGFYYVHVVDVGHVVDVDHAPDTCQSGGIYECKAKGIFRKDNVKPLVGDDVELEILDETEKKGNIIKILPRSSELIRPAVANVDQAVVIFSITKPQPNFNLLDRFLIMMEQQKIPCIICFNKLDLDCEGAGEMYRQIYEACGYQVLTVSAQDGIGVDRLRVLLAGKTTTVAGPSGVGKSSLINCLQSGIIMETGSISKKIERGKHTTRHTELIPVSMGTGTGIGTEIGKEVSDSYILDTPGFSSLGLFDMEKEDLGSYYPEFEAHEKYCRFGGCSHISEPGCGVKQALEDGAISRLRYDNYCLLYEELKMRRKY